MERRTIADAVGAMQEPIWKEPPEPKERTIQILGKVTTSEHNPFADNRDIGPNIILGDS